VDDGIRKLADEMFDVMYRNNGVGLAAEQVGRTEAMFVVDTARADEPEDQPAESSDVCGARLVLINPEITATEGEQTGQEGCLSFPEIFVNISRAAEITVRFMDLDQQEQVLRASGLLARAIQHEVDHLNGILLVDRMSAVQKVTMAGRLKRLKRSA
jgi:peptide deformylase